MTAAQTKFNAGCRAVMRTTSDYLFFARADGAAKLEFRRVTHNSSWRYVRRVLKETEFGGSTWSYIIENWIYASPSIIFLWTGERIGLQFYAKTEGEHARLLNSISIFDPRVKGLSNFLLVDIQRFGLSINGMDYRDYWGY